MAGYGVGDYWEIYNFAKQIWEGVPAPWNIYNACDVTLMGIMAVHSRENGGATDAILASTTSVRKRIAAYPDTKPAKAM